MTVNYRSRSADVRREAADILWRFRSSRAARRSGSATEGGTAAAHGTTARPGLAVSPATEELIRAARGLPPAEAAMTGPVTETEEAQAAGPGRAAAVDPADPPAPAPVADAKTPSLGADDPGPAEAGHASAAGPLDTPGEPEDAGDAPISPGPRAAEGPDPTRPVADDAPGGAPGVTGPAAARDLTDLPGVGAGLVWLLGRCGIHTLSDLAHADAARLEQELGLVGQLLDLPSWIDLARQAVDTERKCQS